MPRRDALLFLVVIPDLGRAANHRASPARPKTGTHAFGLPVPDAEQFHAFNEAADARR
jgi:hypothetical protein